MASQSFDWTTPRLAAVVWTLPTKGWWIWAKLTDESFPPGPGDLSILRRSDGDITAIHHVGGRPPLNELGPISRTMLEPDNEDEAP